MTTLERTILVASGTANTGSRVVRLLSESGQVQVRALTRNPEGRVAQSLSSLPNVTVVKGDFTDKASLAAALAGVSRALLVCANNDDSQSDKEIAFIEAATEAGVEAVVRISTSAIVIGPDSGVLYGECHARIEKHVEERGSRVVDLQPNFFFTNLLFQVDEAKATGKITYPLTPESAQYKFAAVSPEDVATAAVACLLSMPEQLSALLAARTVEVHGPEEVSMQDMLDAIGAAMGKPLAFNYAPPEDWAQMCISFGMPEKLAKGLTKGILIATGVLPSVRPRTSKISEALAAIWQPKQTLKQWAQEDKTSFGVAARLE